LEIEGTAKPKVPKLACPTCLASKARKSNRPPANSKEERSTIPWEDIHSDLSGKISTRSARGYKYFVVFICTATGAKHVEFLAHKNHFINAYRRLVIELGAHPKTLRTDQGTEYLNKEMTELLESNYVKLVVAAVNEHYSNGPAAVSTQYTQYARRLRPCSYTPTSQADSGATRYHMQPTSTT